MRTSAEISFVKWAEKEMNDSIADFTNNRFIRD
jgi:hypothetical protein